MGDTSPGNDPADSDSSSGSEIMEVSDVAANEVVKTTGHVVQNMMQNDYSKDNSSSQFVNIPSKENKTNENQIGQKMVVNQYTPNCSAPYVVYIQSKEENIGMWHPMKLGRFLFSNKVQGIVEVSKISRNRNQIEFYTHTQANKFLENDVLKTHNLIAFIPTSRIQVVGLVRNVDTDLTIEDIKNNIGSEVRIKDVIRITRRVQNPEDNSVQKVPTRSLKIIFDGQHLPDRVYLFYNALRVDVFIFPVIQCLNCLRFGHMADQCKGKTRCGKCALEHKTSDCKVSSTVCINCQSFTHKTQSFDCPEYLRQKSIKRIMALDNIAFHEVFINHPELNSPKHAQPTNTPRLIDFPRLDRTRDFNQMLRPGRNTNSISQKGAAVPNIDYATIVKKRKFTSIQTHPQSRPTTSGYDTHTYQSNLINPYGRTKTDGNSTINKFINTRNTNPPQTENKIDQVTKNETPQGVYLAIDGIIALIQANENLDIDVDTVTDYIKKKLRNESSTSPVEETNH